MCCESSKSNKNNVRWKTAGVGGVEGGGVGGVGGGGLEVKRAGSIKGTTLGWMGVLGRRETWVGSWLLNLEGRGRRHMAVRTSQNTCWISHSKAHTQTQRSVRSHGEDRGHHTHTHTHTHRHRETGREKERKRPETPKHKHKNTHKARGARRERGKRPRHRLQPTTLQQS